MLVKDCDCEGTSSTGQMRYEEIARGAESITFRAFYHQGPSCDVCGKPWVEETAGRGLALGDYVLVTKYSDGDPGDAWALGFYDGERGGRHFVRDANGEQIRVGGFRRVAKIRGDVGRWLLGEASNSLEKSPPGTVNLWAMLTPAAFGVEAEEND